MGNYQSYKSELNKEIRNREKIFEIERLDGIHTYYCPGKEGYKFDLYTINPLILEFLDPQEIKTHNSIFLITLTIKFYTYSYDITIESFKGKRDETGIVWKSNPIFIQDLHSTGFLSISGIVKHHNKIKPEGITLRFLSNLASSKDKTALILFKVLCVLKDLDYTELLQKFSETKE